MRRFIYYAHAEIAVLTAIRPENETEVARCPRAGAAVLPSSSLRVLNAVASTARKYTRPTIIQINTRT